jgi:glutathione S-transferase
MTTEYNPLTLYNFQPSGNCYKVRLTLHELGIPFKLREMRPQLEENKEDWYLKKNPIGQVPTLELEDGACLTESTAILFYLAEGTPLLPPRPMSRIRILEWMCFEQTRINSVISRARFRRILPAWIPARPEEFMGWWKEGTRSLKVVEDHLRTRSYLVDEQFTIADICVFAYVHVAEEGGYDLHGLPAIRRWIKRIQNRPRHIAITDNRGLEYESPREETRANAARARPAAAKEA